MQSVESLGGDVQGSDKTECEFSAGEIVVNSLGNPADGNTASVELSSDTKSSLSAENHKGVDSEHLHVRHRFFVDAFNAHGHAVFGAVTKVTAISRAEDRSPSR